MVPSEGLPAARRVIAHAGMDAFYASVEQREGAAGLTLQRKRGEPD